MNSNWFKCVMRMTKVSIGKHVVLKGIPVIFNKNGAEITVGDNVVIKSSFLSNLIGLYSRTIIVTRVSGAKITIGRDVGISGATIYARKEIIIGSGTLIGGNAKILDNDFHPVNVVDRLQNDDSKIRAKPIHIGKNCFIGTGALILKGTDLGDGCVVGAGAVVSGSFAPNSVIVGNPAKVIRSLGCE